MANVRRNRNGGAMSGGGDAEDGLSELNSEVRKVVSLRDTRAGKRATGTVVAATGFLSYYSAQQHHNGDNSRLVERRGARFRMQLDSRTGPRGSYAGTGQHGTRVLLARVCLGVGVSILVKLDDRARGA